MVVRVLVRIWSCFKIFCFLSKEKGERKGGGGGEGQEGRGGEGERESERGGKGGMQQFSEGRNWRESKGQQTIPSSFPSFPSSFPPPPLSSSSPSFISAISCISS